MVVGAWCVGFRVGVMQRFGGMDLQFRAAGFQC